MIGKVNVKRIATPDTKCALFMRFRPASATLRSQSVELADRATPLCEMAATRN
jgi:hypothetical protein